MMSFTPQKTLLFSNASSELSQYIDPRSKEPVSCLTLNLPSLTPELRDHLNNEVLFLKSHKHPNLVQLKYFEFSKVSCHLYPLISNEILNLGSIFAKKGVLGESQALGYFAKILKVYDLYKSEGMPPRDFSLEGIWLDAGQIKILDLGFSHKIGRQEAIDFSKPPEVYFDGARCEDSEVWTMGMILYYLLLGNFPWRGKTESGFFTAVRTIPLKIPSEKQHLSAKTIALLTEMLVVDPSKRAKWREIMKREIVSEKLEPEAESAEKKWKCNIFSFYCKNNEFIIKNSFSEEKKEGEKGGKKVMMNYPSLDENVKSLSEFEKAPRRVSVNARRIEEKAQRIKNEEKRIFEIDNLIQRLIDNDKMNFSLKQNPTLPEVKSSFRPGIGESVVRGKLIESCVNKPTSIYQKPGTEPVPNPTKQEINPIKSEINPTKSEMNVIKSSFFGGKSVFPSSRIDLPSIFDQNLTALTNQLEKYNVLGKTIGDSELVFRKVVDMDLWVIQRFLLMKKLLKFRFALSESLSAEENLLNLPYWSEFLKSEKFQVFLAKIRGENDSLLVDFGKLHRRTLKSLKKFDMTETNKISKFLNTDLSQNFDSLFFICLYLHVRSLGAKIEAAVKYNDFDKALKLLMHTAEIQDCVIINELDFMTDIPEYFNLNDFRCVIDSQDLDKLRVYVARKEKVLENWRAKYIPP